MRKETTLLDLKAIEVDLIKKRPAISVFRDKLSLGAVLENAYVTPKYRLCKHGIDCKGINRIYREYNDKNLIFIGEGGVGKTSAFLRLYTDTEKEIADIEHKQFFYFFAPDLNCENQKGKNKKHSYNDELRQIIKTGTDLNGILLLDGLEEAYFNDAKKACKLIKDLANSNIVFWVSCRTSFYEKLSDDVILLFAESIKVKTWDTNDFKYFIDNCLMENDNKEQIKRNIDNLNKQIASLIERPLFATMILFVAEDPLINSIYNEYELIELFLDKWIEREKREKNIDFNKEKSYTELSNIALSVYLRDNNLPKFSNDILVFRDLLVMSTTGNETLVHSFFHREFLVYFIVNALIDAALNHSERIIKWFTQTFYDDITNLIKPVLSRMEQSKIDIIYDNLFYVYRKTYENKKEVVNEFKLLGLMPLEDSFLKLRDEILYFILKLPNIDYNSFVRYAYDNSCDTMLFLGIAYGMAAIDPNNQYTLEFAKKLVPGENNEEEIRNRGWGMCFFGDVSEDGYKYDDSEKKPWDKLRENRLKRISDDEKKYVTRVLDIPLLHCFYANRDYHDCTSFRDYTIINNSNIDLPCFGLQQQAFMKEKKKPLVTEYKKQLLSKEIKINTSIISEIRKDMIVKMSTDKTKTLLEIDEEFEYRILKQIEHRELVCENIKSFWKNNGEYISKEYKAQLLAPEHNNIDRGFFDQKIKDCKILIISANYVEGVIVSRRLMQSSKKNKLDAYATDGHLYQFATIHSVRVLHIWPTNTSSYTRFGSFSAIDSALDKFTPKLILSVGVAFGIDPRNQSLGDVLIAKNLVFYDNFNKVTNGKMQLHPQETYQVDANLQAQLHQLDKETPPESIGGFKWFFKTMLTGGTVLSDVSEKEKLLEAATGLGYEIIGGEMEASGIYYACQRIKDRNIPFIVIKGICDWGAEKNGWNDVIESAIQGNEIKDYVQAFACDNAYKAMSYIISQINME